MTLAGHLRAFVYGVICGCATPAYGQVHVVDGDTLRVNGTTVRLHGIDAPELSQTCADGWAAGIVADANLRGLIQGRDVTCEPKTTDRYGRVVAVCTASGIDLGEWMVRHGYAWAFTRYSQIYRPSEDAARAERIGIHARACQPAWEWRKEGGK